MNTPLSERYWFADWMKQHGVRTSKAIASSLSTPKGLQSLLDAAPDTIVEVRKAAPTNVELVAGKGLDFSGRLGCHAPDCLKLEIDTLYRHIWHYFDQVIVADDALFHVRDYLRFQDVDRLIRRLGPFCAALEHLRQTKGDQFVSFSVQAPGCNEHLQQHAADANLDAVYGRIDAIAEEVDASATSIEWERRVIDKDHTHLEYTLLSDAFEHTEWGFVCLRSEKVAATRAARRRAVARAVVRRYLAELSADTLAARRLRAPLGAAIPFYRRMFSTQKNPTADDVAFELALPVAEGISTEQLLQLRRKEGDAFERFRHAIKRAMAERVQIGERDARVIAEEIKSDIIDPELRKLNAQLKAAERMANRSAAAGIVLGAATATIGLLLGGPVGGPAAIAGGFGLGAAALKKSNDDLLAARKDVAMSDMYFLWRGHSHRTR